MTNCLQYKLDSVAKRKAQLDTIRPLPGHSVASLRDKIALE